MDTKKILDVAAQLDILGKNDSHLREMAQKLRDAVTSGKTQSNESSETNEGGEQGGGSGSGSGSGGGGANNPGNKPPFTP